MLAETSHLSRWRAFPKIGVSTSPYGTLFGDAMFNPLQISTKK